MNWDAEFSIRIMEAMKSSDKAMLERGEQIIEDVPVGDEKYRYHCLMLSQAGLIKLWPHVNFPELTASGYFYVDPDNAIVEAYDYPDIHAILAHPLMLTPEGHQFLETTSNKDAMGKFQALVTDHGVPFAFSMMKEVGLKFLTS